MADGSERSPRRGSADKSESETTVTSSGPKTDPKAAHDHVYSTTIRNPKDMPFRKVCDICGDTQPLGPEDEKPA